MRNQRGSVTLFVLIAMLFFLIIAMTAYVSASGKLQGQNAEIARIKASYEKDLDDESLQQLYNRLTKTREWFKGSGTLEDTYKIYTIEDLVAFSIKSNGGDNFTNQYVELMNDLDFNEDRSYAKADRTDFGDINGDGTTDTLKTELTTGKGFPCIADTPSNKFSGNFLGNQHEIRNVYIYNTVNQAWKGFFSRAGNANIQDLTLSGNYTTTVTAVFGGIIGQTGGNGSTNIKNCHSKVNISSASASYTIGGIVGEADDTCNITDCHNEGNISGGNNTGGIVALNGKTVNINNCYNTGNITNLLGQNAGGLIGRDHAATDNTTIVNSYNVGKVSGKNAAGGVMGRLYGVFNIIDSYNDGEVNNISEYGTGGIIGRGENNDVNKRIEKCYNKGTITAPYFTGGIFGRNTTGTVIEKCYNEGNIKGVTNTANQNNTIGGIAGQNIGTITKSYNKGTITAVQNCVGGIAGTNPGGTISLCYNDGIVNSTGASGTGGIVGYHSTENPKVINCYNLKPVTGKAHVGGIIGNHQYGEIINCYNIAETYGNSPMSIAGAKGTNGTITNCYYLNSLSVSDSNATGLPASDMTSTDKTKFLDLINASQTDTPWQLDTGINNGYPIFKWQTE